MVNKNIKNLIFDLGGVLLNLNRERCIQQFKQLGCIEAEKWLNLSELDGFFLLFEQGKIDAATFRTHLKEAGGFNASNEQIDAAWNSLLVDIPTHRLNLLLELRKNYVVYLLSNTNMIHWQWTCQHAFPYRSFKVNDFFERIYLSFEMHLSKPDPDIFQTLMNDAGILANETFFIDDSAENCRIANKLGISTYTPKPGEEWCHFFNKK